jgi:hypothetical protein
MPATMAPAWTIFRQSLRGMTLTSMLRRGVSGIRPSSMLSHLSNVLHSSNRCFPHCLNLGSQVVIKAMENFSIPSSPGRLLMTLVQSVVKFMRASSSCCTGFIKVIESGNIGGDFEPKLPTLTFLRDMEVRWDSTFMMLDHFILLEPVCIIYSPQLEHCH